MGTATNLAKGMPNPWDIPPFPERGDQMASMTYEAVGRALSQWEETEVSLSHLYGLFSGEDPHATATYTAYGAAKTFSQRADDLSKLAERYFIRHINQATEGKFKKLIAKIKEFSARRNDIAHGIVKPVQIAQRNVTGPSTSGVLYTMITHLEFCLTPPTYTDQKFDRNNAPTYLYTSNEINHFSDAFFDLNAAAKELYIYLAPKSNV